LLCTYDDPPCYGALEIVHVFITVIVQIEYFVFFFPIARHLRQIVIQARNADGSVFSPINELLKSSKMSLDWLEKPSCDDQSQAGRRPPHARLPDEFTDELPVHAVNDRSVNSAWPALRG